MRTGDRRDGPQGWAAPLGMVFLSPLGWAMLPVLLFGLVILAGIGVTLLPVILSIVGVALVRRSSLASAKKLLLIPLILLLGFGLNALAWHTVYAAAHERTAAQGSP